MLTMHISSILVYIMLISLGQLWLSTESKASYSILILAQPKQNVGINSLSQITLVAKMYACYKTVSWTTARHAIMLQLI